MYEFFWWNYIYFIIIFLSDEISSHAQTSVSLHNGLVNGIYFRILSMQWCSSFQCNDVHHFSAMMFIIPIQWCSSFQWMMFIISMQWCSSFSMQFSLMQACVALSALFRQIATRILHHKMQWEDAQCIRCCIAWGGHYIYAALNCIII